MARVSVSCSTLFWLLPSLLLLAGLSLGAFWVYPSWTATHQGQAPDAHQLQIQMSKDFLLLASLLKPDFAPGRAEQAKQVMRRFFEMQGSQAGPYLGVVMLDQAKTVLASSARPGSDAPEPAAGTTYANLNFQDPGDSAHRLVVAYRPDPKRPGGQKSVEMALEIWRPGQAMGWLLLQMDMEYLARRYSIKEQGLLDLRFPGRLTP